MTTVGIAQPRNREAHGARFSLAAMQHAQAMTWEGVRRIAAQMKPGMSEREAVAQAEATLQALGMERLWHKTLIRFGSETLKTFKTLGDPERMLGETDIFFVDIGVVWDGHEGDAGDTFVVGDDPEMAACAEAARTLWRKVAERWRRDGLSGQALYAYAEERAQAMGWRLNLEIRGHRVCDFPHAIYKAGDLGDFELCPTTGLWILEIQITHPSRPFGAFFEDLLVSDGTDALTAR
jgi:Xaa-Pro aminopeptidase